MAVTRKLWSIALMLHLPFAIASPTSDEYIACHHMALDHARRCLDEAPGGLNDACWESAKLMNNRCYAKTAANHTPDKSRIEAEKKAKQNTVKPSH